MISVEHHPTMRFPTGWSGLQPALGQDGVIGLKLGFTDAHKSASLTAAFAGRGYRALV